ncbi:MAG: hypothetical protein R2849_02130 [Thermomicrobiales bacterium]
MMVHLAVRTVDIDGNDQGRPVSCGASVDLPTTTPPVSIGDPDNLIHELDEVVDGAGHQCFTDLPRCLAGVAEGAISSVFVEAIGDGNTVPLECSRSS